MYVRSYVQWHNFALYLAIGKCVMWNGNTFVIHWWEWIVSCYHGYHVQGIKLMYVGSREATDEDRPDITWLSKKDPALLILDTSHTYKLGQDPALLMLVTFLISATHEVLPGSSPANSSYQPLMRLCQDPALLMHLDLIVSWQDATYR